MPSEILIVGAGPVGLTLACELARHGAGCRIIDRLAQPLPYCRAIGVTPRTLEVLDDMGLAREAVDAGLWLTGLRSIIHGHEPQDALAPELGLPYAGLGLPQYETERILTERLGQFGIRIERGLSLTGFEQDDDGVTALIAAGDGEPAQARFSYIVGCDGAHSAVRRQLAIPFEGDAFPWPFMLGDVHIDWDVPYGMAVRALRPVENAPPDMFIAIPLPEPGRYRVSMMAPAHLAPPAMGSDHGIQAEIKGPSLQDLQQVANDLLPAAPVLSDMRWSSIFRISMRLAAAYRSGRAFIAGDAAHIHPPTGGQGMNTGIQDAYNLGWKLALVAKGQARPELLGSYESERRPVGADVVARTTAASQNYGREAGGKPDRLADTQIRVSYRGTDWVCDDCAPERADLPVAGDRAPDAIGLERPGIGFPLRLFDMLRGPGHVLVAHLPTADSQALEELADWARTAPATIAGHLRVVAIVKGNASLPRQKQGVALLHDRQASFEAAFGRAEAAFLIRPDGHIGWSGDSWKDRGLERQLARLFGPGA